MTTRIRTATLTVALFGLTSCGGEQTAAPIARPVNPPPQGFTLTGTTAASSGFTGRPGGVTATLHVSVTAVNGFTQSVAATVEGLPSGAKASPPLPLSVAPGTAVDVTFQLPGNVSAGTYPVTIRGISDTLNRTATVTLSVLPAERAFRDGDYLKLERVVGGDSAVIAARVSWGASITELSLAGVNVVNAYDTGREVQVSVYDGFFPPCTGCANPYVNFGWNPVQGGDWDGQGSQVELWTADSTVIYSRATPNQWYPDNKGGGKGHPIPSDLVIEQWITPAPQSPRAFHVHIRLTHTGADTHVWAYQEMPCVYANVDYNRLVTTGSGTPWVGSAPILSSPPAYGSPAALVPSREGWAGLVDASGTGIFLYVPQAYPSAISFSGTGTGGPGGTGSNYLRLLQPRETKPLEVVDFDYYVVVGDVTGSRATINAIRQNLPAMTDILMPRAAWDTPVDGATVTSSTLVQGWAFDNGAMGTVQLSVDGGPLTNLSYGLSRPDVAAAYPGVSAQVGFSGSLSANTLSVGPHTLEILVRDAAGNSASLGKRNIVR